MIPIGTRCIRVGSAQRLGECEVIGYDDPSVPAWDTGTDEPVWGCDHKIFFDEGCVRYEKLANLIPIGHDPDTETRKTEREVTA